MPRLDRIFKSYTPRDADNSIIASIPQRDHASVKDKFNACDSKCSFYHKFNERAKIIASTIQSIVENDMTFPEYYTPNRVGLPYIPETRAAVDAGQDALVSPASEDRRRIYLLLVDMQVDFIHRDGTLTVPGAIADTRRTVEWIYRNTGQITQIGASLDSHVPIQIFFPTWWVDKDGKHPDPYTAIPLEDVQAGIWNPLYEREWSLDYVETLERNAKKTLMIWPYHTLIGTPGHTLVPALYEAIAYHTAARKSQPTIYSKGSIAKTEHYSIMEPEVKVRGEAQGDVNEAFLDELSTYDLIYVAGQAKSHCVLETISSMMRHFPRETIQKMRVLQDAMSPVPHPEIDFDALADATFERFQEIGLAMVDTSADLA